MEVIIIIDFGSQYTRLIAKEIRKLKMYCEIINYKNTKDYFNKTKYNVKGIILSGGPYSVNDKNLRGLY